MLMGRYVPGTEKIDKTLSNRDINIDYRRYLQPGN